VGVNWFAIGVEIWLDDARRRKISLVGFEIGMCESKVVNGRMNA
jgi:hypothetical protein